MLDKNCRCSPWGVQRDKHLQSIVHYSSNLGGKWAASSCPCWQPASAMLQVLHHLQVQVADWHSSHVPGRRSHLWWRPQEESLRNWAAAPETSNCSVYSGCSHHKTPPHTHTQKKWSQRFFSKNKCPTCNQLTNQGTTEPSPLPGQEEFCDTNWASDLRGASAAVAKVLSFGFLPPVGTTRRNEGSKPLSQAALKHIHTRRRSREAKATRTPQNTTNRDQVLGTSYKNKSWPKQSRLIHCKLCSNTVYLFLSTLIYI